MLLRQVVLQVASVVPLRVAVVRTVRLRAAASSTARLLALRLRVVASTAGLLVLRLRAAVTVVLRLLAAWAVAKVTAARRLPNKTSVSR